MLKFKLIDVNLKLFDGASAGGAAGTAETALRRTPAPRRKPRERARARASALRPGAAALRGPLPEPDRRASGEKQSDPPFSGGPCA